MTRRQTLAALPALLALFALPLAVLFSGRRAGAEDPPGSDGRPDFEPLDVPHSAWKGLVSAEAYAVLFQEATEPPGSSPLNDEKRDGSFVCAACYLPLFRSDAKYDSGTGWPSFFRPIEGRLGTKRDFKLLLPRTEYHCARCGGHQGHVFDDGPPPTGKRYCNNGLALRFVPESEALPELREPTS